MLLSDDVPPCTCREDLRRPALDGRGEFPAEIHRVSDAGIQALSAEGRMDVCGIAGEQHATFAIGCRLTRAVGVARSDVHGGEGNVGAGDAAQNILQAFERDGLRAIERSIIKLDHPDAVRPGTVMYIPVSVRLKPGRSFSGSAIFTAAV